MDTETQKRPTGEKTSNTGVIQAETGVRKLPAKEHQGNQQAPEGRKRQGQMLP